MTRTKTLEELFPDKWWPLSKIEFAECVQCGEGIEPRRCGERNPCPNCGNPYPSGDCSD